MEERRTAAWVLGVLAIIALFFIVILPRKRHNDVQKLAFKSCAVNFYYNIPDEDSDVSRAAHNTLALCLCKLYQQKPDTATGKKITDIFRHYDRDSARVGFTLN